MIPEESRFTEDPDEALADDAPLPADWTVDAPDPGSDDDVAGLTTLLRAHEEAARGWASADADDVLLEISDLGTRTRANIVLRDGTGRIRAWGSVHDRAVNRMLYAHVIARDLSPRLADRCSRVLFDWAESQAREVGAARGLSTQQIDSGAFADDPRQHAWLTGRGFTHVRTWWQMSRPVAAEERDLVPGSPDHWEEEGVVVRLVARQGAAMPEEEDLREVHQVLEGAFTDHFNSREEDYHEFLHRLRQEPGHRWAHWWLAELVDGEQPEPTGALIGSVVPGEDGPDGSYVDYIGVLANARGRGVGKSLLRTVIADAAVRGRDRVGLEVDADSPTGAESLYTAMGWTTRYVTQSWHKDVPVTDPGSSPG